MESNSDKQFREKLKSIEYPFDPKAWDGMEEMLDRKKKRRGIFWWWTGGIAAALLFGTIGYELHEVVNSRQEAKRVGVENAAKGQENGSGAQMAPTNAGRSGQTVENSGGQITGGDGRQVTTENAQGNQESSGQIAESGNGNPVKSQGRYKQMPGYVKGVIAKNLSTESAKSGNSAVRAGTEKIKTNSRQKSEHKKKNSASDANTRQEEQVAIIAQTQGDETTGFAPFKVQKSLPELILDKMTADELKGNSALATDDFNKKLSETLPKMKKRVFHYSFGVIAGVSGTTLGKQPSSTNEKNPLFFNQPTYTVGLTHDFLFVNRVAITNSILFSQTSFKVNRPLTVSFSKTPSEYTSRITELDIPIGIKVYPVVKNNFRFYINTGIINHIKLKETFNYRLPADTVYNNNGVLTNLADNTFFPVETNFVKSNTGTTNQQGYSNSTKDFSLNNAKRYYTSFYASAGFEYIAKRRLILFAEPMFYMSLQKIGVQDKRKYNLGVSGGMRYQF